MPLDTCRPCAVDHFENPPEKKVGTQKLLAFDVSSTSVCIYSVTTIFCILQKDLATLKTNEGWSLTLEERFILGKYREAPRIDYGVKHKAGLLIMRIYTCVLMLYKGRRSRTPPVYSLFKFQSKFMFCECKTVFLLLYFKILTNFTCKRI